ncbi:hypothetical protein D0864_11728 [Hortaea werneckii]|uniref:Uncharacterized protein n=1 Tax=Hortaea werneckii TaxID=91943 RepID=A0A3M7ERP8_HORWE|nr:hypothetical protein D0864_11728 [Hortaea werneckii]RMY79375.1 hypothetical protein D0862_13190 [Hortaea werneckii]
MHGLFAIPAAAALAYAVLNVTFCSDSQCEQLALGFLRLDETDISKCHRDYAGEALALNVQRWQDSTSAATETDHMVGEDDDEGDASLAIPIEEWDDDLHQPLDGTDYDPHGAVSSDGKHKQHQISDYSWKHIPLEEWDDQVHIKNSGSPIIADLAAEEDGEAPIEEEEREAGTGNPLTPQDDVHEYL